MKEEEDYFVKQETYDADTSILDSGASEMGDRFEVLRAQRIVKTESSPPPLLSENVSGNWFREIIFYICCTVELNKFIMKSHYRNNVFCCMLI